MQGTPTNGELTGEMWETIPSLSLPLHFRVRKQTMFGTIAAASFSKMRRVVNEKQWTTDGVHATGAPHGGSNTASSPAGPANPRLIPSLILILSAHLRLVGVLCPLPVKTTQTRRILDMPLYLCSTVHCTAFGDMFVPVMMLMLPWQGTFLW